MLFTILMIWTALLQPITTTENVTNTIVITNPSVSLPPSIPIYGNDYVNLPNGTVITQGTTITNNIFDFANVTIVHEDLAVRKIYEFNCYFFGAKEVRVYITEQLLTPPYGEVTRLWYENVTPDYLGIGCGDAHYLDEDSKETKLISARFVADTNFFVINEEDFKRIWFVWLSLVVSQ